MTDVQRMIAIDFESDYNSKTGHTLRSQSTYDYIHDPRFNAYLVSIVSDDYQFVGSPKDADWQKLDGRLVVAHNCSYDAAVFARLQETGVIPTDLVIEWVDTADMAAYFRCKRDLKSAAKHLLGVEMSKAVRTKMDGLSFTSLSVADRAALLAYADNDSVQALALAKKYYDQWPANERELSRLNREAGWRGIVVDVEGVNEGISTLHTVKDTAADRIPWVKDGEKAGSAPAFRKAAADVGIPVPACMDKKDPTFKKWVAEYGDKFEWIKARQDHAAIGGHLNRLISLRDFNHGSDHVFPIQIKYCGATATGRFSGGQEEGSESGGKFNPQNLARFPLVVDERTCAFTKDPRSKPYEEVLPAGLREVNLRGYLRPLPGRLFFIADYAQIEARIVQWLAGNKKFIKILAAEGNIYQAFAKLVNWYPMEGKKLKTENPSMYQLAKATVLGGGYGMGWERFQESCASGGMILTEEEAQNAITAFRTGSPEVVNYWDKHQHYIRMSAAAGDKTHEVVLRSGRVLTYFQPKLARKTCVSKKDGSLYTRDSVTAWQVLGGIRKHLWGGMLVENETQALARDVMCDSLLAVVNHKDAPDIRLVMTVHDEIVFDFPEKEVDYVKEFIPPLLVNSTPYMEGCPLDTEWGVADKYGK